MGCDSELDKVSALNEQCFDHRWIYSPRILGDSEKAHQGCQKIGVWLASWDRMETQLTGRVCFPFMGQIYSVSSVQFLNHVCLFATPRTAARQASQSITNSQSLLKLMFIESVMPFNLSSSVVPLSSCLQSFSASGCFPRSQFFASGGRSIGASALASVLSVNIQD